MKKVLRPRDQTVKVATHQGKVREGYISPKFSGNREKRQGILIVIVNTLGHLTYGMLKETYRAKNANEDVPNELRKAIG